MTVAQIKAMNQICTDRALEQDRKVIVLRYINDDIRFRFMDQDREIWNYRIKMNGEWERED